MRKREKTKREEAELWLRLNKADKRRLNFNPSKEVNNLLRVGIKDGLLGEGSEIKAERMSVLSHRLNKHVEVGGQFIGFCSLLPPCVGP